MGLAGLARKGKLFALGAPPNGRGHPAMAGLLGLTLALQGISFDLKAGDLDVSVTDREGRPIQYVVVSATPIRGTKTALPKPRGKLPMVTIAQKNKEFVPYVTAIQTGTAVSFPNEDDILHNVYSFSRARKFELPLYKDKPPAPVIFDQPGVVVLGCNIHDWMVAYVYVLETPYFATTDNNGSARLEGLAPGEYALQVQHPRKSKRGSSPLRRILVKKTKAEHIEFVLALKPEWRPKRAPDSN
ncbi:MAG: hypothetical protein ACE5H7_05355 [Acidiferrobacterales bacterium]